MRDARASLNDVLERISWIRDNTRGSAFEDYQDNKMLRSAVERDLEIIGEALNNVSKADPSLAAGIPLLRTVVGFRNILAHGYVTVDDRLVWAIVQTELDGLEKSVQDALTS